MKIKQTLQYIINYIDFNRRVGHTTTMIRGVQNVDEALVIAADSQHASHLQNKLPRAEVVALTAPGSLLGKTKPLAIDNHALWLICRNSLAEIERLEALISRLSSDSSIV